MKKNVLLIMIAILGLTSVRPVISEEYNWEKVPYPFGLNDQDTFHSIHAFNMNEAIAVGSKGLIKYVNIEENIYSKIYNCGNTYRWVSFADSVHGWIVGDSGCIAATADRGRNWTTQNSGVTSRLNAVAAIDKNHAWIAGDSGIILYTSDGGKNWIRKEYENPENAETIPGNCIDFVSISFKNGEIGCVGGNWRSSNIPVAMFTCDSGVNWYNADIFDSTTFVLYEVAYHNETPIIYVEHFSNESRMKTNDSPCRSNVYIVHKSLQSLNHGKFQHFCSKHKVIDFQGISNRTIMAIDSIEPFRFWIAGTRGSIYRTTNSGEDWWAVCSSEEVFIDDLESVYFSSSQRGFIGGRNGTLFCTENGGKSWQLCLKTVNAFESFRNFIFYDSLNGYLIRHNKPFSKDVIMGTGDGGKTWSVKRGPSEIVFLKIFDVEGILSYDINKEISFSVDKGNNWRTKIIETDFYLYDIFPITLDTFFTLGTKAKRDEGAIFKSTDGGESFDLVSSVDHADSKYKNFLSITFSDSATGWVVGDSGIILKTTDSGYTWQRQPSPTTDDLIEIHFRSPYFGWTSGENCRRLYLTFDGGNTWVDKSILTSVKVNDIFCSDPQNCWAVGDDGLILHLSNKLEKFIDITFPGNNETFVIGDSVTIKWNSDGISQVSIAISYDGGKNYTVYCNATENDGEETIRISANATVSDSCKVRISSVEGTITDESGYFTITKSSAVANYDMLLKKTGCYFKGASIQYYLTEDAPVEITIFTVSGREVYRERIPLQDKGTMVRKVFSSTLKRGCYLAKLNIGGKYFKGKLIVHR